MLSCVRSLHIYICAYISIYSILSNTVIPYTVISWKCAHGWCSSKCIFESYDISLKNTPTLHAVSLALFMYACSDSAMLLSCACLCKWCLSSFDCMYWSINRWRIFKRKASFATTWSKKGGLLISKVSEITVILFLEAYIHTSFYILHYTNCPWLLKSSL